MFLSRGDRDLRVAFQTHPGSQASSRGEAMDSAVLSSREGYLLESTEWPKGNQASCGVWREDSGLLSGQCRERSPSSRDDQGLSWFSRAVGPVWRFSRGRTGCPCGDSHVIGEWQCKGPGARSNLMHEMCFCGHRWGNGGDGQLI